MNDSNTVFITIRVKFHLLLFLYSNEKFAIERLAISPPEEARIKMAARDSAVADGVVEFVIVPIFYDHNRSWN